MCSVISSMLDVYSVVSVMVYYVIVGMFGVGIGIVVSNCVEVFGVSG